MIEFVQNFLNLQWPMFSKPNWWEPCWFKPTWLQMEMFRHSYICVTTSTSNILFNFFVYIFVLQSHTAFLKNLFVFSISTANIFNFLLLFIFVISTSFPFPGGGYNPQLCHQVRISSNSYIYRFKCIFCLCGVIYGENQWN